MTLDKSKIGVVKVRKYTKERLDKIKKYRRETYEEVINELIDFYKEHKNDNEEYK